MNSKMLEIIYLPIYYQVLFYFYCLAGVQIHLVRNGLSLVLQYKTKSERRNIFLFFPSAVGAEARGNSLIHSKSLCQSWNFNLDLLSLCSAISNVSVKADLNFCHISKGSRPQTGLLQLPYVTAMPQRVALTDRRHFPSWQGKCVYYFLNVRFGRLLIQAQKFTCDSSVPVLRVMVPAAEYLQRSFDPQL